MMKILNEKGVSLVQGLIGAAMMAGIGVMVSQQMGSVVKTEKRNERMQNINLGVGEIQAVLAGKHNCSMTLGSAAPDGSIAEIKYGEPDPSNHNKAIEPTDPRKRKYLFRVGEEIGKTGLSLGSVHLMSRGNQDYLKVVFSPSLRQKMTGDKEVVREFLVSGIKENGKYVSCFTERMDSIKVIKEEACKAINGTWSGARCELASLPKCIIAEKGSCSSVGYTEMDIVRVGYNNNGVNSLFEMSKCCREFVAPEPWPVGTPVSGCEATPNLPECQQCTNPGPTSSTCPTCGPGDGLPYWSTTNYSWTSCGPGDTEKIGTPACVATIPGVTCEEACGPAPTISRACPPPPTNPPPTTPPPSNPPPSSNSGCNVDGQEHRWGSCKGTFSQNYNHNESVEVPHAHQDGFKGKAIGQCKNGSIDWSSQNCEPCTAAAPCPGACSVPNEKTWGGCKGNKNVTTASILRDSIVKYENTNADHRGWIEFKCVTGGQLEEVFKYCGKECVVPPGEINWAPGCGVNISSEVKVPHGYEFKPRNTKPGFYGFLMKRCDNGTLVQDGGAADVCDQSQECTIPAETKSWGAGCVANISEIKIPSGGVKSFPNEKPGFTGNQTARCTNGTLSWDTPQCFAKCTLPADTDGETWGAGCAHGSYGETIIDAGRWAVFDNTKPGFTGKRVARCDTNGTITWDSPPHCLASAACTVSTSGLSWGPGCGTNSGGTITIASGSYEEVRNQKPDYQGYQRFSCNNGTATVSHAPCEGSRSCTIAANPNVTWLTNCKGSIAGGTIAHNDFAIVTNTASGWNGSKKQKCVNGSFESPIESCTCAP